MNRSVLTIARIMISLLLSFAGGSFPVNAGGTAAGPSNTARSAASALQIGEPSTVFLPLITKNYIPPAPLWRFGSAISRGTITDYDPAGLVSMRFGWYVDFVFHPDNPTPYGVEYMPTVRVKQLKVSNTSPECCVGCAYVEPYTTAQIGVNYIATPGLTQIPALATAHPGMTWLIGNEMDRIDSASVSTPGACNHQDEMLPELYAQVYHDYFYAIKAADPTAQVAIGGMVEFTPLRQQYLDRIWAAYTAKYSETMPIDTWNIHLYILREEKDSWGADIPAGFDRNVPGMLYGVDDVKNFSLAWTQIVNLRTWMKAHGQQNKPLIITEYGVLFPVTYLCDTYPVTIGCPYGPEAIRDSFMYPSFDAFLNTTDASLGYPADGNRLVQRWNWFSIDFDYVSCFEGKSDFILGGALFNSGKNTVPCSANDHPLPPLSITELGRYWQQYVRPLPAGAVPPYTP